MLSEFLPFRFEVSAIAIAGTSLWALALYLGFSTLNQWVMDQFNRWFNFAERFLYTSVEEFERTRQAREAQNSFYASIFSILAFLIMGGLYNYGVELSLGRSWAISMGIMACISGGVYELGRRGGESN